MKSRFFSILMALSLFMTPVFAQKLSAYKKKVFRKDGAKMPYRLLLPKEYDTAKKYPLILVLHGSGERGKNNKDQLVHGAKLFLKDEIRADFQALVVFPQCAANSSWVRDPFRAAGPTKDLLLLEELLVDLKTKYAINEDMMYVGGLSMGGMGTFELVRRNPEMFAAAFPICGGANPEIAESLKAVHWWVFHGEADTVVPPKYSTQMVEALTSVGAAVKYDLYPGVGHNSWDKAFATPELLPWLFSKSK